MTTTQQLIDTAADPSAAELRRRSNWFLQGWRFVVLGWRMFRLAQH